MIITDLGDGPFPNPPVQCPFPKLPVETVAESQCNKVPGRHVQPRQPATLVPAQPWEASVPPVAGHAAPNLPRRMIPVDDGPISERSNPVENPERLNCDEQPHEVIRVGGNPDSE